MTNLCKKCGKSLVSTRAGSFTSYFFQQNYCQCHKVKAAKATTASQVCTNCGKSVAKKRAGSFTSFLFQELRCQCAQPALAKKVRMGMDRTNTQTRHQAMASKRGYTANFRAHAESGQKLPHTDFSAGTVIGGVFKISSVIGEGGMGIVYLAHHLSLGRPYALKILSPSIVSEQSWLRFKAEAKTLAALNHPGLVRVYDLGIHESSVPYYSMDYLEGANLESMLMDRGPQKLESTIAIFLAVLDALAYAHRNNVVHRDIKPANIFICQSQEVKILDFGISKLVGDKRQQELTAVGEVFGSPYYMSPEQCRGEQIDFRSDIYSVGCSLFEALTCYVPFDGDSSLDIAMLHEEGDIPLLAEVSEIAYPPSLDVVLAKCLAKLPQDRYQSAKEMAIDLNRIKEGKNLVAYASPDRSAGNTRVEAQASSKLLGTIGYSLLAIWAVCLVGALVYYLNSTKPSQPIEKPNVKMTISPTSGRPIADLQSTWRRMPYMGDVMTAPLKFVSPSDVEVKNFLRKPFKFYSQTIVKNGQKYKGFTFPERVSLGTLYCRTGSGRSVHDAKGTVLVPFTDAVALSGNATLQFHPQLLNNFRSDDLVSLSLSSEITRVDLMLASIAHLTSLETLSLNRIVFNERSPRNFNRLVNLKSVAFYDCKIAPEIFSQLAPLKKVHTLVISGVSNISPQLRELAKNANLKSLTISYSSLTKDDLRTLSTLKNIDDLSLRCSSIRNDDLKILTAMTNLRQLNLDSTMVDKQSIDTLLMFRNLERLVVEGFSPADEKRLLNGLPKLRRLE